MAKNGINPNPVTGTRPLPNEVGTVFPHHRLPPSGPVLPSAEIVQFAFKQAFSTKFGDTFQLPASVVTPAALLAASMPEDVSAALLGPTRILGVSLPTPRAGNMIAVWYSFGFVGAEDAVLTTILGIDDGTTPNAPNPLTTIPVPGAVQTMIVDSTDPYHLGSILTLFPVVGALVGLPILRVFPLAATSTSAIASIIPGTIPVSGTVPPLNTQTSLMVAEIQMP